MNAVIYLRVGRTELSEYEINKQKRRINQFIIRKKEYKVIDQFIDKGYQGIDSNRLHLDRLINNLKQSKFDVIIVDNYTQLFRNILQIEQFRKKYLIPYNVKLISVSEFDNQLQFYFK